MVGGTSQKLGLAAAIIAGVASLVATILSMISTWLQTKNYRKPLLQRYVVRIMLMVPIYSLSSYASMVSLTAAAFVDPIRDIYEAFTIYTFFQLLINYLGGERALIIMTHGREPIRHLWPLHHCLPPVDISDPYTFLAIKRGILQYAWLKPILGFSAIIMRATNTYQEGYIGLSSGYFWSGLIYNLSVTVSLYSLALFWVCMHEDLKPFRPVPKFLCIKLIIFASYWQGFFLSILVWLGAIPDNVEGYTPDNLAAAIQDFLICIEMPGFAIAHWYAFSWHDFADDRVSSARMPVWYACRDAFGIRDLVEDTKETFKGDKYRYRLFDSGDKIMAHESSRSRLARLKDGMRYERGGKGKYWIPQPDEINQNTPLLGANGGPSQRSDSMSPQSYGPEELVFDPDEEVLYDKARKLEFGDWNYPVITAHEPRPWNSPHPSLYQNTPTGSPFQEHTPNLPPLSSDALNSKKKKGSREPSRNASKDKGKSKLRSESRPSGSEQHHGVDPLEIAYGPIMGTNPVITEDDFETNDDDTAHKPQLESELAQEDLRQVEEQERGDGEGSRLWEQPGDGDSRTSPKPQFIVGDEDDDQNVWGK